MKGAGSILHDVRMKYHIGVFLLVAGLFVASGTMAREAHARPAIATAELVSVVDLGVDNPGLLPTNPFYFFKEWGRSARRAFAVDAIARARLEADIANEKAAELKKIQDAGPEAAAALKKAIERYRSSQERLKGNLESLKETAQNQEVNALIAGIVQKTVAHEKVFDEIIQNFQDQADIKAAAHDAKAAAEETAIAASGKDTPVQFIATLEKALVESKGSDLKHLRSIEIIGRLKEKAPAAVQDRLERLRRDFVLRAREDIGTFIKEYGAAEAAKAIAEVPGDLRERTVILEEIKLKAGPSTDAVIDGAADIAEKAFLDKGDQQEKAEEQIRRAEAAIAEALQSSYASTTHAFRDHAAKAQNYLKEAKAALAAGKYGEAFGQARAAESIVRLALKLPEAVSDEGGEEIPAGGAMCTKEYRPVCGANGKTYGNACEARAAGATVKSEGKCAAPVIACLRYDPVCGSDGVTYGCGEAEAQLNGIKVAYKGECKIAPKPMPPAAGESPALCTQEYAPVCGADGRTYGNACMAQAHQVPVVFKGECVTSRGEDLQKATSTLLVPKPLEVSMLVKTDEFASVSVTIDEKGNFVPAAVKVRKGGKVTWINKSQRFVWPASGNHPTHSLYPEFDALRGIAPGETYSFTFEKPGTWPYHDHLNAAMTGTVEVIE